MNKNGFFNIEVQCYEGYKAAERPVSFYWGSKSIKIKEIIDHWQGEDHTYYKIQDSNGSIYIIRRDITSDFWEIVYWKV